MQNCVDHEAHGWALLAMRLPQIRTLSRARASIAEMCECYSLAMLYLCRLRNDNAPQSILSDYEEHITGIEEEILNFLVEAARQNA